MSLMKLAVSVQLNELMDPESGFLGREGLILRVDVLECCPWFEFADLETYTSGMSLSGCHPTLCAWAFGSLQMLALIPSSWSSSCMSCPSIG